MLMSGSVQGDSTQQHVKSLDVVLGAEMAVLIVDDTAGVWPQHSRNLLQVSASHFQLQQAGLSRHQSLLVNTAVLIYHLQHAVDSLTDMCRLSLG